MTDENETNFNEIAAALAEAAGLDSLKKEEDGKYLFAVDETMGTSLVAEDAEIAGCDLIVASIIVGPAPEDAEALRDLLEQNYLGAGSGDGTFSIEHDSSAIVLYRSFPLPMDPTEFVNAFARLVGAARAAKAHLEGVEEEGTLDELNLKPFILMP